MRILHLISQHPESTGSGYFLQNVISQASAAGHRNFLVAGLSGSMEIDLAESVDGSLFVRFEKSGPGYPIPGMSDVMPYPSSRFSDLTEPQLDTYQKAFADTLHQATQAFQPDIIHSHHLWLATAVARTGFPDIPLVTTCHSTDLRQFVFCPHIQQRVLEPCRKIDRIMALGREQKKKIQQFYGIENETIEITGAGFNPDLFTFSEKSAPPPVHLLYAGKLSYAKGIDRLLKVFGEMETDDLHLHIAGSGSGKEAEHCLGIARKLHDKVTVYGRLSQPQLAALMAGCDIFVLPSWYEGLPLVLLEAVSTGCRIICTNLPGCVELLGANSSDLVRYVDLPPLLDVDTPDPCGLPEFDRNLRNCIQEMAKAVYKDTTPPKMTIDKLTSPYRWKEVFSGIEAVYKKVLTD